MGRRSLIDGDKLRVALLRLEREELLELLERALGKLQAKALEEVVEGHLDLSALRPDDRAARSALLPSVQDFEEATLARQYYESFNVNSKNYKEKSAGTTRWIADCKRLARRCVSEAGSVAPAELAEAVGIILGLLERIDQGEEIIFFADEAGSWQVGLDTTALLRVLFRALAASEAPEPYARRVLEVLKRHSYPGSDDMAAAREVAAESQREVLDQWSREGAKKT